MKTNLWITVGVLLAAAGLTANAQGPLPTPAQGTISAPAQGPISAPAQRRIPASYKWLSNNEVAFTYDGSYTDNTCFKLQIQGKKTKRIGGVKAP